MRKITVLTAVFAVVFASGLYAKKPVAQLSYISGGITIDGSLSDWKKLGIKPLVLDKMSQVAVGKSAWDGADVHNGKVYVAFSDDMIYVAADVKNKTGARNKHKEGDIYQGTNIELFVGFDNSEPDREMYTVTDYQVGISTGQWSYKSKKWLVKPSAYGFNLQQPIEDAKVKVIPKKGGYIIEAALPADFFEGYYADDGLEIGFDVGIDDVGPRGYVRKTQMVWSGDPEGWKNPSGWGKAKLKAK